jgi:hypothetical protein
MVTVLAAYGPGLQAETTLTIATMPARMTSGRVGDDSTTAAQPGSVLRVPVGTEGESRGSD